MAQLVAEQHQRSVDTARGTLLAIARLPSVRTADSRGCSRSATSTPPPARCRTGTNPPAAAESGSRRATDRACVPSASQPSKDSSRRLTTKYQRPPW